MIRFQHILGAAALTLVAGTASGQSMTSTRVATGLARPTYATSPAGDFERVFIVEQYTARIRILKNGTLNAVPFIDLNSIVIGSGNERGLLGLAFHPDYANNRKFYVSYNDNSGRSVVREYMAFLGNPEQANSAVFTTIFGPLPQPFSNHNGGCLQFGPDGMLYFGLGDGGSANDPGNRAQNLTLELGKMLRLDVDNSPTFIPVDNPYIGAPNDPGNTIPDTIWSYGWRNPWRFSFDRVTGALYVGDVGQNSREELDYLPASSTGTENLGWRCMEGNNCTGLSGCVCNAPTLTDPIHTYSLAGSNCSIIGGYVYRGDAIPGLQGTYFYADHCSNQIWSLRYDGTTVTDVTNRTAELAPNAGIISSISSFGQDAAGELYICDLFGGELFRIDADCTNPADCSQSFCDANDDSHLFCPCAAGTVDTGCDIAQATGGVAVKLIGQNTAATQATLQGSGFPPANSPTAIVIRSSALDPAGPQVFGDGVRCVSTSPLVRLASTSASGGTSTHVFGHGAMAAPGLFYYQLWFRNTPSTYCDATAAFNLSNGVSLFWP